MNENEPASSTSEIQNQLQSQIAEYAMVLDLLGRIGVYDSREKTLEGIREIFTSVLGARHFCFFSPTEDLSELPAQARAFLEGDNVQFLFEEKKRRFFIAVKHAGQVHGILEAGDFLFPQYINRYLNVALNVSNIERYEESVRMAQLDPLTGAYNWRYVSGILQTEVYRSSRTGRAFSLIMLDLDHFKQINDRFGHQKGDLALKTLVETFKNRIRKTDVLARRGGDEFLILLRETNGNQAVFLAEELRASLSPGRDIGCRAPDGKLWRFCIPYGRHRRCVGASSGRTDVSRQTSGPKLRLR